MSSGLTPVVSDDPDIAAPRHDRRLLDEGRQTRAMVWIMAVMLFLTVLAAALGLAMARAGAGLERQLAGRLTVQLVEPDATLRDAATKALVNRLNAMPDVARAAAVDRARLAELLKPWLGADGADPDLPMPALIDVDLSRTGDAALARVEAAARAVAPAVRVDRHAAWMSPVSRFIGLLTWVAAGLVALLALATGSVVLLAARAGLDTHRDTIAVLHGLGSTDGQIARLFQNRIALDTLRGGLIGAALAMVAVVLIGGQAGNLQSELAAGAALRPFDWLVLVLLPFVFAVLALVAARATVLRALGKVL